MPDLPLPDLAASIARTDRLTALRTRLERAGQELATGRKADLVAASGRDPGRLIAIESGRSRAEADLDGLALAESRVIAAQTALGRLEQVSDDIGVPLLAAVRRGDLVAARTLAAEAEGAFADAVGRLNGRVAGRALFSGAAVDRAALADPDAILADLRTAVAGAADPADLAQRVDAWFADPVGGFTVSAWRGEGEAPAARLGEGVRTDLSIRADATEIRDSLKGLALAIVAQDPGALPTPAAQAEALGLAAERAVSAREGLVRIRADLGLSEARIDEAATAARARRAALDAAWNDIVAQDPYVAATRFQELETGLQTAFAVAGRLARLDFAAQLR